MFKKKIIQKHQVLHFLLLSLHAKSTNNAISLELAKGLGIKTPFAYRQKGKMKIKSRPASDQVHPRAENVDRKKGLERTPNAPSKKC
jgi:hypothetical protein